MLFFGWFVDRVVLKISKEYRQAQAVKSRTCGISCQRRRVDSTSAVRSNVGRVLGGVLLGASGDGGLELPVI